MAKKKVATRRKSTGPPVIDLTEVLEMESTIKIKDKSLDVCILSIEIADIEEQHDLKSRGWRPTTQFLESLSAALERLGVAGCTPSVAYSVWHTVGEVMSTLKNVIGSKVKSATGTD